MWIPFCRGTVADYGLVTDGWINASMIAKLWSTTCEHGKRNERSHYFLATAFGQECEISRESYVHLCRELGLTV